MKDNEKCGQCRFFVPEKAEDGKGECRRHSPRPGPSFQIGGKDVGVNHDGPKLTPTAAVESSSERYPKARR